MTAPWLKGISPDLILPDGVGPGMYEMTAAEYHADPCIVPSLNSSTAKVFDAESALHAHHQHPRFGGYRKPPSKIMNFGKMCHAILLGGDRIELIKADNYKTKDASRARAKGLVGVAGTRRLRPRSVRGVSTALAVVAPTTPGMASRSVSLILVATSTTRISRAT